MLKSRFLEKKFINNASPHEQNILVRDVKQQTNNKYTSCDNPFRSKIKIHMDMTEAKVKGLNCVKLVVKDVVLRCVWHSSF